MTKGDMYQKQIMSRILNDGYIDINPRPKYADGTPAHTLSVNSELTMYDLEAGETPMTSLRPIAWRSSVGEILWIYQDQSNDLALLKNKYGVTWWDKWESKDMPGTIGQRYGATIRKYDSLNRLLYGIQTNPYGRRHIMSMWQEADFAETEGLMPCCYETLWFVRGAYLDMTMVQRSSDFCTAACINEIQYVALMMMVARHCGYRPGVFTHYSANVQIYDRHVDNARILLQREPLNNINPRLILNPDKKNFYDITLDDFSMIDYPVDEIKAVNPQLKFELGI